MLLSPLADLIRAGQAAGLDADQLAAALDEESVLAILKAIDAEKEAERFGKFRNVFPDEMRVVGDSLYHPREAYPKHLEFFRVGKTHRERCFMAGNRCFGPWSFMEMEGATIPALEAVLSTDVRARSWDGVSEQSGRFVDAFLKGIEPAYRLVMEDGAFFDCSRDHQLLTVDGWCSLDRLVSLSGGLRSWHSAAGYRASCATDGYLGDGLPPRGSDSGQGPLPSPADVRERVLVWSQADAAARTPRHIRQRLNAGLRSIPDDRRQIAALCAQFAAPASSQPVLRLSESTQELQRLARASVLDARQGGVARPGQYGCQAPVFLPTQSRGVPYTPPAECGLPQSLSRSLFVQPLGQSVEGLVHGVERMAIFYPSFHPELVGGQRIVAIAPIGYQPIFDAHVPGWNSYRAAGAYHHNCGKTFAGAYETACHLTGLYPHWWEGRRFRHPIRAWACGKTNETTRDIVQKELLGEITYEGAHKVLDGSGMIPRDKLDYGRGGVTWKQGVADLVDRVRIKHVQGGWSYLGLKSYQQGRGSFEGTAQHVVWDDEEPPLDVWNEQLLRTATTKGIMLITFTPLEGISDVVQQFLPSEMRPGTA